MLNICTAISCAPSSGRNQNHGIQGMVWLLIKYTKKNWGWEVFLVECSRNIFTIFIDLTLISRIIELQRRMQFRVCLFVYIPQNVTLAGHKEPDPVCVGRLGAALRVRPGPAGLRPPVCRGSLGQPAGDTVQCVQVRFSEYFTYPISIILPS